MDKCLLLPAKIVEFYYACRILNIKKTFKKKAFQQIIFCIQLISTASKEDHYPVQKGSQG